MRNLVVCCDGTWNSEDQTDGRGLPVPTNVAKLFHAAVKDPGQRAYYHSGVGTEGGWWARLRGGAMGVGLGRNIQSAYGWLAQTYEPGDRVFIFGFSRGAYTARALAGMIGVCGLLDLRGHLLESAEWARIATLYERYRTHGVTRSTPALHWSYHNTAPNHDPAATTEVHFVGVWDTVGSFGVPAELGLLRLVQWLFPVELHDNRLGEAVVHARHAVALDENRATFMPTLWDERPGKRGHRVQSLKQIWFPGCHSDVGGGYSDSSLSDGALRWMIDEASALGLRVDAALVASQTSPDALGILHQSVEGVFKRLRTEHRPVPFLGTGNPILSKSTQERLATPTLRSGAYRPTCQPGATSEPVEIFASKHWNETGIYLRAGKTYRFRAEGEWIDKSIKCGPAGALSVGLYPCRYGWYLSDLFGVCAKVLNRAAAALDWLGARVFRRKRSPLRQHEYYWTRRYDQAGWFVLIGVIANGTTGDDSVFEPNQTLAIGRGGDFRPVRDGYLFCFANDAWRAYDNNHGSVMLTVEAI